MNKTTLTIASFFALATMLSIQYNNSAQAYNNKLSQKNTCATDILDDIGKIDSNKTILIDGITNNLYCTFINKEQALENLSKSIPEILNAISIKHNLEKINNDNQDKYRDGLYQLSTSEILSQGGIKQYNKLLAFFDIYENNSQNDNIINYLSRINTSKPLSQTDRSTLALLLPYYSPLVKEMELSKNHQMRPVLPNIPAAVNYAVQYAWNPNTSEYGIARTWYGAEVDCTNFVSQILEASGISQEIYDNPNYGWWHKKNNNRHTYSISWIRSDTFARFMGVGLHTKSHEYFSSNIFVGDFVSADFADDGSWDHSGFVTYKASDLNWHNGKRYYDYIIAQHTPNYNMWASEQGNHWEEIENTGGRYARVRR